MASELPITEGMAQAGRHGSRIISMVRGDGRIVMLTEYPNGNTFLMYGIGEGHRQEGPFTKEEARIRARAVLRDMA